MRLLLTVVLLSASVLPCPLGGQVLRDPIQAPAVSLGDWDLTAAADVRFGRVALINGPDGSRLELRKFASTEPSRPSSSNRSHTPSFDGNTLIVADFSRGNRSPLGGYFGTFQRAPSVAEAGVEFRPDGRRVLGLDLDYRGEGFCGSWVQLYDNELSPAARSHLDSRGFSTLSFWIRGREGGERVLLKVADPEWEGREDALAIGEVSLFLPSGRVDTHWQQGVVALDRFPPGIRRDALALIVFEGLASGTEVELGPIGFSLSPTPLPDLPPPTHRRPPERPRSKGTWVWNTASLLRNPTQVPPLLDFLEGEGFDHVFLQLPTDSVQVGRPGELTIDVDAIRGLVGGLNARGMKVYALDGYAGYALPGFHAGVLSTIDHVVEYNREVAPGQRFFGVRYDIEPYLLPSFHGPNRENLLTGLLQLTEASVKRAHDGGLVYGADIPFWYDVLSEDDYRRVTATYKGVEKALSEHLIDLVDDVAVMDYRTVAHGADGTVRHGSGEVDYASKTGKRVFIALETGPLPDEVLFDFRGEPGMGVPSVPTEGPIVVMAVGRDSAEVALMVDPMADGEALQALEAWLGDQNIDPHRTFWWAVSRQVEVPAEKITFAEKSLEALEQVMRATVEEFWTYPSFVGFAIHYAESYRSFIGR